MHFRVPAPRPRPTAGREPGVWECQPGGWPVVDRPDTEFTYIISGRANLTDAASGEVIEIGAGDLVILPPGWTGRWDVIEPVRKVYAID
ncbi:cupin domain-containing protein [Burkholderia sp. IMCC1007]|uniref:cupin domain-containing protein n=1 Tax=Burkholderia sp. IMCC1007 TaxID=3004104 RepID=UPI0022B3490D|nr:cupin domain-containing protein [Burkholderia sp. IMCC1007]